MTTPAIKLFNRLFAGWRCAYPAYISHRVKLTHCISSLRPP
ncbi:hypothetical protein WP8W19C02_21950 [Enterobacter cloacae]|nr:hypothetical protein WP8W19C02_21950 [Enterobacter cloacae]